MADKMIMQASLDQRERLTFSTERLNQSSERIMESRRTMLETEELGVSIVQDLHQQRETLLHAHHKVGSLQFFFSFLFSKKLLRSVFIFFF